MTSIHTLASRPHSHLRRSLALCSALLVTVGVHAASPAHTAPSVAAMHPSATTAPKVHSSAPATTRIPDCGPNGERICTPHGCYCA